jgi:1,5-anhydro-D-fructose reductase (1,5-anhydro-D-mannitol-forming)
MTEGPSHAPVGWAFIGTSGWVGSRFAPSVTAAGQRVLGAVGSSPSGSAAFAGRHGGRPYRDLAELLADPDVEAVWVASPTGLHDVHARAVAAAGKALLVEKPLTADVGSARLLVRDLAGAAGPIGVGFQHRFNPGIAALAGAVAEGVVGELSSLSLQHAVAGPSRPTEWRTDAAGSGGWSIADIGTHLLDLARHLVGEVELRSARLSSPGRGLDVDDLSVLMLVQGEATVLVRASTGTSGPPSAIELGGTRGWARLAGFWTGGGRYTDSLGADREIPAADPYVAQVAAFSAAVRGEPWRGARLDDGLRVVELVDAARDSSAAPAGAAALR